MNMSNVLNLKIGDIAKVYAGGTPSRKHPEYWGGTIPWVKTTHIQNCTIERDDIDEAITDIGLKFSSARVVSEGTILMAMIGQGKTRGQVAILNVEAAINQNCVAIVLNEDIDRDYLWHQLRFRYHAIRNISNSSGQQNLNGEIIKGIVLPFPSHEKQHCIGKILNQWDAAIEKTEAFIEAKERQFRWLIHNMIGRYQFADEWSSFTLEDIFKVSAHKSKSAYICEGGKYYIVDMGSISRHGDLIATKRANIAVDMLEVGELVMPKDDIGGGNIIGKVAVVDKCGKYVCGDHVYRLRAKCMVNPIFIKYVINSATINKMLRAKANGTSQLGLGKKDVLSQVVRLPGMSAQQDIANTLGTAQQEIDLLKKLVDQYRTQKRGLMQKLLINN